MSFGLTAAQAVMIAAATTAATSAYTSKKQANATTSAAKMQKKASDDALRQQTQEMNRANQQTADMESVLEGNTGSDVGSTMLTGASGIKTLDDLILGRGTNLLGG